MLTHWLICTQRNAEERNRDIVYGPSPQPALAKRRRRVGPDNVAGARRRGCHDRERARRELHGRRHLCANQQVSTDAATFDSCTGRHSRRSKRRERGERSRPTRPAPHQQVQLLACVEINQCVGCTRKFFTKSFLGDGTAALAPSSGEESAPPRHRAGGASMAWRSTRRFRTKAP